MQLNIAICDDEERIGFQIEECLGKLCNKLNIQFETDVYYTGENLCEKLSEGVCYDLIFLDIELANINGVQVGTVIRDKYNDELMQIVYISGKSEYALQLFDINPLNFLVKPLCYKKIEKVINKFLKITGLWSDVFTYKYGHDTYKIKLKDIIYFESNGKKIIIHLKDGRDDEFYGGLEDIYNSQLKKCDFLFIHKSYVVNYDYVSAFEYERLTLSGNIVLPISQPKRKEIRKLQNELEKRRL